MKYKIVKEQTCENMEREINRLVRNGWKPQGGVSISFIPYHGVLYAQAMVKEQ